MGSVSKILNSVVVGLICFKTFILAATCRMNFMGGKLYEETETLILRLLQ